MFRNKFSINNINNGALTAIKAMPQKDTTSDNTSDFSMGRTKFIKTYTQNNNGLNIKKWIGGNRDASHITAVRRYNETGRGSLNAGGNLISFTTNKDINTVNNALTRVRAGGSIAPPKKAASLSNTYVPTPVFQPLGNKFVYGNKIPFLYH